MTESNKNPKIAVVIGAGGIKTIGAIALFDFLEKQGVDIHLLVGCSSGAEVCALKALGYSNVELEELYLNKNNKYKISDFKSFDYRTIASWLGVPGINCSKYSAIFRNHKVLKIYDELFGDTLIETLKTPLIVQTTDLESGEERRLSSGILGQAVCASQACLPFFPPLEIQGRLLGDGAYANPVPISTALDEGAEVVIALGFEEIALAPKNLIEQVESFFGKVMEARRRTQMALSLWQQQGKIFYIHVRYAHPIMMWDIGAISYIIQKTREVVQGKAGELITFLHEHG